ncbi:MAG: alkaline phosphatase family protein, partial [Terriglobus roseus]|nr:alkaline phosphatase family protein [Terriglobus roseus]
GALPPQDRLHNGTAQAYAPQPAPAQEAPPKTRSKAAPALETAAVAAAVPAAAAAVKPSNSKRLRKQPPQEPAPAAAPSAAPAAGTTTGKSQLQMDRAGKATGIAAARQKLQPDLLPPQQVVNHRESAGPKYEIPPQTAAGQAAREQVGFTHAQDDPAAANLQQQRQHHLGNMFHHDRGEERRYHGTAPLDEWRSAQTATLTAEDLNVADAPSGDQNTAWWEKDDRQRRRSAGSKAVAFDGVVDDDKPRRTYFQPPLYLKCGPLLRYCGTRRAQTSAQRVTEVWRGTVLIVTDDTQSNTQTAPSLRLFVQPRDLIPPPPMELNVAGGQELASEYVDPLAGQVHMSRIGKTLYVRPVEALPENEDLSRVENDSGLFEEKPTTAPSQNTILNTHGNAAGSGRGRKPDGEKVGKYRDVKAVRLFSERNTTFWRFNIEVELGQHQARVAYRINNGPAVGFWVPARGQTMNIMFHSCNGFSLSVTPKDFCGPDPMWRDVLNCHQTKPFHVMIGGGDQIYNDAATKHTKLFREWCEARNPHYKHGAPFTLDMQNELEAFYLERYAMWFSQGLFGMANAQIPMVNMWDDHDIIDGFGSYPHHFMGTPIFTGVGAVAFKYYMLFQHHSLPDETEKEEPSWLLGAAPGPYIEELSRSLFMFLGRRVAFLGLDCRTERMKDEVLSQGTYDLVFERLRREIIKGDTQHLI